MKKKSFLLTILLGLGVLTSTNTQCNWQEYLYKSYIVSKAILTAANLCTDIYKYPILLSTNTQKLLFCVNLYSLYHCIFKESQKKIEQMNKYEKVAPIVLFPLSTYSLFQKLKA